MKTLKIEWRPEISATIALRMAERGEQPLPQPPEEAARGRRSKSTNLIVISESGTVLHRCIRAA